MSVYKRSRFFLQVGGRTGPPKAIQDVLADLKKNTAHGGLWKCDGGSHTPKTVTPIRAQVCAELEIGYEKSQF